MSIVDRCIAAKVKLIVDIDDYWNVPKYNPAYKVYKEKGKEAVLKSLKAASMVWTTTPQLAEKVKEINPNVHILPNYIDHQENQWLEKNDHPLTIGYVGGFSHLEDVKLLRGQIGEICEKYNARFLFCGYNSTDPNSAEMEYQITGSRQRPDWFWVGEVTSVLNYGKYYSHIDVVLAPLTETHFNKHKSELKIVEAAAYKLPILVSEVEPYTNHRDNEGVTFVKNNDWSIIGEVIKNRKELGEKNYKYCLEHHNIETINQKRITLIYGL
jgi:glycosyltransferase involved in cell wall biosynthesis